jgi:hypothetical protein
MFSMKRAVRTVAALLAILVPVTASAGTVERVTVTGSSHSREKAITRAAEAAVLAVMEKYIVSGAISQNRNLITDEILANSSGYLESINIVDEKQDEEGIIEVTAEAVVEVGRLVTTLRNLDIAVKLPVLRSNQVVEGRRGDRR